jgi:putative membrane protein insertion efficiency factor
VAASFGWLLAAAALDKLRLWRSADGGGAAQRNLASELAPSTTRFTGVLPPPVGEDFAVIAKLLILVARAWQLGPSRVLPPTCRYTPSCSQYAIVALGRHGAIKGGWLAVKRLLRCHPWGGHGHDPVP